MQGVGGRVIIGRGDDRRDGGGGTTAVPSFLLFSLRSRPVRPLATLSGAGGCNTSARLEMGDADEREAGTGSEASSCCGSSTLSSLRPLESSSTVEARERWLSVEEDRGMSAAGTMQSSTAFESARVDVHAERDWLGVGGGPRARIGWLPALKRSAAVMMRAGSDCALTGCAASFHLLTTRGALDCTISRAATSLIFSERSAVLTTDAQAPLDPFGRGGI